MLKWRYFETISIIKLVFGEEVSRVAIREQSIVAFVGKARSSNFGRLAQTDLPREKHSVEQGRLKLVG